MNYGYLEYEISDDYMLPDVNSDEEETALPQSQPQTRIKNRIMITGCAQEAAGILTIPDFIDDIPVTHIHAQAFLDCYNLTGIILPETLECIGSHAFEGCSSLAAVDIPESVTEIGTRIFYGCESLLHLGVAEENLSYASQDDMLFDKNFSTLMESSARTEYTIPDTVDFIAVQAFAGCTPLMSVTIPDNVDAIPAGAFKDCSSLISVTFPAGTETIAYETFSGCASLKDISIPDTVTAVEDNAFAACTALDSLFLPDSVHSLGSKSFSGCASLTSVRLPENIAHIGYKVFIGTPWFQQQKEQKMIILGGKLIYVDKFLRDAVIPDTVTVIEKNAFGGCFNLVSVHIPDSVALIETNAFEDCFRLTSIVIPASVEEIKDLAFTRCKNLRHITFLNPKCKIAKTCFKDCNIRERTVTIRSYEASAVRSYALSHGFRFEAINDDTTGEATNDNL